jgi:hypothetical protein
LSAFRRLFSGRIFKFHRNRSQTPPGQRTHHLTSHTTHCEDALCAKAR